MDAEHLLTLLTDPAAPPQGIKVVGETITGTMAWAWQKLPVPLEMFDCVIEGSIKLDHAQIAGLTLVRCQLPEFSGEELVSANTLGLRDCECGWIMLRDAKINGSLLLQGSTFQGRVQRWAGQTVAVYATRVQVTGAVYLGHGFTAEGAVVFTGAKVGAIFANNGRLSNPEGDSFTAPDCQVSGSVVLGNGLEAVGRLLLDRMEIAGNLVLDGATLRGAPALEADRINIGGGLYMRAPFRSYGLFRMESARVAGNFHCEGAKLEAPGLKALNAANLSVEGDVRFTDGFRADGEMKLSGAHIAGELDFGGATLHNPGGVTLNASDLEVEDSIFFRPGFVSTGEVLLRRARIGGTLDCTGGDFVNPGGQALAAASIKVGAGVQLGDGYVAKGATRLVFSEISGDLVCEGGVFDGDFAAGGASVSGSLRWRRVTLSPTATVNVRGLRIDELDDDVDSWPAKGLLRLTGFTYQRLSERATRLPKDRVEWVRRQPDYTPEPYQQLASVYRESGQEAEAVQVAIAQQDDLVARGDLRWPAWAWRWFLGKSIGHGYRPGRAAWALLVLYLLTFGAVFLGVRNDAFIQTGETAPVSSVTALHCGDKYPCLSVPAYALENITPILNLHQTENWQPKSRSTSEWALRDLLNVATVLGYAFTTLLAAALSGLARRV